jgi:macrolide transport system ATP-binding/permease protein
MMRLCGLLAALHPSSFRRAHGLEIGQFIRLASERGFPRPHAIATDLLVSLVREWLEEVRRLLMMRRQGHHSATNGGEPMGAIVRDIRYALRLLAGSPGFTCAAIATLALGIGANTAIFSLADATLLRPLRVANPDELVTFSWSSSYPDYLEYAKGSLAFSGVAAVSGGPRLSVNMGGDGELTSAMFVSGNMFAVLGVPPALGRTLLPADDVMQAPVVAVLSYEYWQARFGSDPGVIGRVVRANDRPVTIVGVAAEGFRGTSLFSNPQMYLPLTATAAIRTGFFARAPIFRSSGLVWLTVIGRLADGVGIEQATQAVNTFYRQLHPEPAGERPQPLPALTPLRTRALGGSADDLGRFVGLLLGVVGLTLLIGCANLANLLLARAASRRREIGLRLALGAARGRVVRQVLTESLLLSAAGGLAGMFVATRLLHLLGGYQLPGGLDIRDLPIQVNAASLAVTAGLAIFTAFVFGAVPAWRASRTDPIAAMRGDAHEIRSPARARAVLVALQVAFSLVLLTGSGLFARSLLHALATHPGFTVDGAVTATVNAGLARYDEPRAIAFFASALERIKALPGVTAAAWANIIPLKGLMMWDVEVEGYMKAPDESMTAYASHVGAEYFRAAGTQIIEGREFLETETGAGPTAAIVSDAFAKRFFPGRSAVGGRLKPFRGNWVTIVGVAENTIVRELGERPVPFVYLPFEQTLSGANSNALDPAHLFVRTGGDSRAILPILRDRLQTLDPALPVYDVQPFAEHVRELVMPQRMGVALFALFSAVALTLALVGIYGVASYAATMRTREIGIRIALGAGRHDIGRIVVRQGLGPVAVGVAAGMVMASWAARFATAFLYDVSPLDPPTYASVAVVLALSAFAAVYFPARRASRLDPVVALRHE